MPSELGSTSLLDKNARSTTEWKLRWLLRAAFVDRPEFV
jgi:hypothetical protein